jgi:hypothetical protein
MIEKHLKGHIKNSLKRFALISETFLKSDEKKLRLKCFSFPNCGKSVDKLQQCQVLFSSWSIDGYRLDYWKANILQQTCYNLHDSG